MAGRSKMRAYDVPVGEVVLRVVGGEERYEEVRAAGMSFFERIQSYGIRNPAFARSKHRVYLPDEAPALAREMAETAALAGVGPIFTFRAALVDTVGRVLAEREREVLVSSGGHHFVTARKRMKLSVRGVPGAALAVVIRPELGTQGVCTTIGRSDELEDEGDGLVVVARSCILAAAAAAGGQAMMARRRPVMETLSYLQRIPGVHGTLLVKGEEIGLAGGLELAA